MSAMDEATTAWFNFYTTFEQDKDYAIEQLMGFYANEWGVLTDEAQQRAMCLLTVLCMGEPLKPFNPEQEDSETLVLPIGRAEGAEVETLRFARPYRVRAKDELSAHEETWKLFQDNMYEEKPTDEPALEDRGMVFSKTDIEPASESGLTDEPMSEDGDIVFSETDMEPASESGLTDEPMSEDGGMVFSKTDIEPASESGLTDEPMSEDGGMVLSETEMEPASEASSTYSIQFVDAVNFARKLRTLQEISEIRVNLVQKMRIAQESSKTRVELIRKHIEDFESLIHLPTLDLEIFAEYVDIRVQEPTEDKPKATATVRLLLGAVRQPNFYNNPVDAKDEKSYYDEVCERLNSYLVEERAFFLLSYCHVTLPSETYQHRHLLVASDSKQCLLFSIENGVRSFRTLHELELEDVVKDDAYDRFIPIELTKIDFEDNEIDTIDLARAFDIELDDMAMPAVATHYFEKEFVLHIVETLTQSPYGHRIPVLHMVKRLNARNSSWHTMLGVAEPPPAKAEPAAVLDATGNGKLDEPLTPRKDDVEDLLEGDGGLDVDGESPTVARPNFDSIYLLGHEFTDAGFKQRTPNFL